MSQVRIPKKKPTIAELGINKISVDHPNPFPKFPVQSDNKSDTQEAKIAAKALPTNQETNLFSKNGRTATTPNNEANAIFSKNPDDRIFIAVKPTNAEMKIANRIALRRIFAIDQSMSRCFSSVVNCSNAFSAFVITILRTKQIDYQSITTASKQMQAPPQPTSLPPATSV